MLGMVSQDDGIGLMNVTETLDNKIKAQEEKLKQLMSQRQAALARERAKEKEQARKEDTRRKILIGSCMLKITEDDEQARAKLIAQMDKYLTDERDRKLFNL
jgi:membrane protein involved in colicin uptake